MAAELGVTPTQLKTWWLELEAAGLAAATAAQKAEAAERHCQTKANRYPKVVMHPPSGRKLAPLGQGSGAVLLEDVAAVEVAILVEDSMGWIVIHF